MINSRFARFIITALALLLTTACTSTPPVQVDPGQSVATKSAASFCPSVWARGGSAFFWGSGLTEVETSSVTHCYERQEAMRCYSTTAGWLSIPRQSHAPLLAELGNCDRWSLQRVGDSIYLIKHDSVVAVDWHPANPGRVYISIEGRQRPIVIPVSSCEEAAEIVARFSRTLDGLPSCTRQAAAPISVLGLNMGWR